MNVKLLPRWSSKDFPLAVIHSNSQCLPLDTTPLPSWRHKITKWKSGIFKGKKRKTDNRHNVFEYDLNLTEGRWWNLLIQRVRNRFCWLHGQWNWKGINKQNKSELHFELFLVKTKNIHNLTEKTLRWLKSSLVKTLSRITESLKSLQFSRTFRSTKHSALLGGFRIVLKPNLSKFCRSKFASLNSSSVRSS